MGVRQNIKPPRVVMGYVDMGPVRIPPLPNAVVMTDRDDGTLWQLSHADDSGTARIMITDTLIKQPQKFTYGTHDGPYLTHGANEEEILRLFVRGGRLGFERVDEGIEWWNAQSQSRLFTRSGVSTTHREIIVPALYERFEDIFEGDTLGWESNPI